MLNQNYQKNKPYGSYFKPTPQPQNEYTKLLIWQREQIQKLRQIQYLKQAYQNKTNEEIGKAFRELMNELYPTPPTEKKP